MTPPTDTAEIADRFRPRLFGIAYRMLGNAHDAEDVVQDVFLRWHTSERGSVVESPEAWLVAVTTRLSIDRLRRAATERAAYEGPWLPEPIATESAFAADHDAELASDLSMAFLVLLERLAPDERAIFLLREVFDARYDEIARIVGKQESAVRQIVHRARARVRSERPRFDGATEARDRLLHRFLAALENDDGEALLAVFADDATFTSDGGGKVSAMRNVVTGASAVTRALLGFHRKGKSLTTHRIATLNGEQAILTMVGERVVFATFVESDGAHVTAVYRVLNPEKLRHLGYEVFELPKRAHGDAG